jgi:hypothetical protein
MQFQVQDKQLLGHCCVCLVGLVVLHLKTMANDCCEVPVEWVFVGQESMHIWYWLSKAGSSIRLEDTMYC